MKIFYNNPLISKRDISNLGIIVLISSISLLSVIQVTVYAQLQQHAIQPPIIGIKITSPNTGQQVPVGQFTISGISTDNATTDCTVYTDWNNLKPFQKALATGTGGVNDYSTWTFTYTDNYHLITNGTNELTSKLSCINNPTANLTKWNSVNVIGLPSDQNQQQPVPIKVNSTTLGNGTAITAALAAGAENGDIRDILPRPIVIEEKQNNLSGSGVTTSPLSLVMKDNNSTKTATTTTTTTTTTTSPESVPSVPITPSPAPSSPPSIQEQEEEQVVEEDEEEEVPQPEPEPQPEDNGDTTFYWDLEEAQDSDEDNEQVFDFEGNIFDLE